MNNIFKKSIILILACAMLFIATVACGGKSGNANGSDDFIVTADVDTNLQEATAAPQSAETGNVADVDTNLQEATAAPQSAEAGNAVVPASTGLRQRHKTIACGNSHFVALKNDGTVVASGSNDSGNYYGQCNVEGWTDIVAIDAGFDFTIGLKSDGTVVACGNNGSGQCNVEDWKDIVAIAAGMNHTVGLEKDGTLVACGGNRSGQCDVDNSKWGMGDDSLWQDIVAIAAKNGTTVALRADGTVLAAGVNAYDEWQIEDWKDVVAIDASWAYDTIYGWKADGTMLATRDDETAFVSGHTDFLKVINAYQLMAGLRPDGTLFIKKNEDSLRNEYNDMYNWKDLDSICIGSQRVVGLKRDGTLVACGQDYAGAYDFISWNDIRLTHPENRMEPSQGIQLDHPLSAMPVCTTLCLTEDFTLAVRNDGTVASCGKTPSGVSGWTDIVAIDASYEYVFGLKRGGTVVCCSCIEQDPDIPIMENDELEQAVSEWTDIVAISAGGGFLVGLKKDGMLVACGDVNETCLHTYHKSSENFWDQGDITEWTDIVAISVGQASVVGLKADGTVVACGNNYMGQCNVSGWTDIVSIDAGFNYTIGLKSDGTVVTTSNEPEEDVSGWMDIVEISIGTNGAVGLKKDGTAVYCGTNPFGEGSVSDWTGIVAICTGGMHTVGIHADGTAVARGSNTYGQCNVKDFTDIRLP